jgi:hypothetical protein
MPREVSGFTPYPLRWLLFLHYSVRQVRERRRTRVRNIPRVALQWDAAHPTHTPRTDPILVWSQSGHDPHSATPTLAPQSITLTDTIRG